MIVKVSKGRANCVARSVEENIYRTNHTMPREHKKSLGEDAVISYQTARYGSLTKFA